jgi:hypothetical protein
MKSSRYLTVPGVTFEVKRWTPIKKPKNQKANASKGKRKKSKSPYKRKVETSKILVVRTVRTYLIWMWCVKSKDWQKKDQLTKKLKKLKKKCLMCTIEITTPIKNGTAKKKKRKKRNSHCLCPMSCLTYCLKQKERPRKSRKKVLKHRHQF